MSKSYYPTDRAGQIQWHTNFATEFPKVGESLGFSRTEIDNAVGDSKYAAHLLKTLGPVFLALLTVGALITVTKADNKSGGGPNEFAP